VALITLRALSVFIFDAITWPRLWHLLTSPVPNVLESYKNEDFSIFCIHSRVVCIGPDLAMAWVATKYAIYWFSNYSCLLFSALNFSLLQKGKGLCKRGLDSFRREAMELSILLLLVIIFCVWSRAILCVTNIRSRLTMDVEMIWTWAAPKVAALRARAIRGRETSSVRYDN